MLYMKNFFIILFSLCLFGCKKSVQSVQEDLVVKAMTDGQWRVTKFIKDGSDITSNFAPYSFQFRTNYTVEAINNSATESSGTWSANATARTIASTFTNANTTVSLLNGTWQITKNGWTFVEATQSVNGEVRTLRLDK